LEFESLPSREESSGRSGVSTTLVESVLIKQLYYNSSPSLYSLLINIYSCYTSLCNIRKYLLSHNISCGLVTCNGRFYA